MPSPATPDLSVVIPVHNSAAVLADTIESWRGQTGFGLLEIIIVENGSSDESWAIANAHAVDTDHVHFRLLQSATGMGNALRAGIEVSRGKRVLLTADDLPFGFDDLDGERALGAVPLISVGSKAHPRSVAGRGAMRSVSTWGFRMLRKVLLRSRVGDSQGTLIVDGEWLRCVAPHCDDSGYLFTTQVVYAAELNRRRIVEVPVRLRPSQEAKASSVTVSDVWRMAEGLIAMRRRKSHFRQVGAGC